MYKSLTSLQKQALLWRFSTEHHVVITSSIGTLNKTHLQVETKLGNKCASWDVTQHEKLIRIMNTQHPVGSGGIMCSITLCGLIQAGISQVTASSDTWEQEEEEKELSVGS